MSDLMRNGEANIGDWFNAKVDSLGGTLIPVEVAKLIESFGGGLAYSHLT